MRRLHRHRGRAATRIGGVMTSPAEQQPQTNVHTAELRRRRLESKASQKELALATGIPFHRLSRLEQGKTHASLPELERLAAVLGCEVSDLRLVDVERAAAARRR